MAGQHYKQNQTLTQQKMGKEKKKSQLPGEKKAKQSNSFQRSI